MNPYSANTRPMRAMTPGASACAPASTVSPPSDPWTIFETPAGKNGPSGAAGDEGGFGDIERRHAAQLAAVLRVVEGPRAVHRGAVVPDHEVADAPGMAVDELRLGRVLDQVAQEEPPLRDRPVDDPRRVRGYIERPAK